MRNLKEKIKKPFSLRGLGGIRFPPLNPLNNHPNPLKTSAQTPHGFSNHLVCFGDYVVKIYYNIQINCFTKIYFYQNITQLTISELTKRKLFFIAQKYFVKYNLKLNTRRKHDEKSNNYLDANVLLLEYHA